MKSAPYRPKLPASSAPAVRAVKTVAAPTEAETVSRVVNPTAGIRKQSQEHYVLEDLEQVVPPADNRRGNNTQRTVPKVPHTTSSDKLPEQLASTLDHIVGQLDILSRTMSILEERLTLVEDKSRSMEDDQRQVLDLLKRGIGQ